MRFRKSLCPALLAISLVLSACQPAAQSDATQTPDPKAVLTAAALTAQARMTALAANTPSPLPPTPTPAPTTATPTATLPSVATTPTTPAPLANPGSDRVEFVADLTVPDGTVFKPGEMFTKTWRLMNAGTSTWTLAYSLIFSSGEQMGGAASTPLTVEVAPGKTADLSVQLTAPDSEGKYTGYWMLRNSGGSNFGMGANSDGAFYVLINVAESAATATTGTGTPASSGTPAASATPGADVVTDVSLGVDEATVEEVCPYTFNFIASFTLSEAATVTYLLEVETGYPITLPGPTTANLNGGTSEITYTLDFTDSVSGTARLHLTAPEDVRSDPVSFTLTCQ